MDKESLQKQTVADLKEQAKKIPGVTGLSSKKKNELIELLLAHAGDAATPETATKPKGKAAPAKPNAPLDKSEIKKRIRALKQEKTEALSSQDRERAKRCNREIHDYKRRLRKMAATKQRV
jgi:hypothetical protein